MINREKPLSERMRPQKLEDIVGQSHLVGEGKVFNQLMKSNTLPSLILWGPPGVGKTTLAQMFANYLNLPFYQLSAISSGVKEVREVIQLAQRQKSILFIDEIHRFNKSQQDSLLGAVEKGKLILIGATTENPSFEVNAALLSRCQVYTLQELSQKELLALLEKAIKEDKWLQTKQIKLQETEALYRLSGGDARRILNLLELVTEQSNTDEIEITNEQVFSIAQQNMARYDKNGEQHYDIISAFIKSIRGSDPNAAVYWLARMIEAGEDPKFIARRLLISASEDIGNANPTALVIANNCFQAVNIIGYPECEIILSQTATYLASSPKSNASYLSIKQAKALVNKTGDQPVPLHLRNAPTKLMKQMDYGKGYKYAHDYQQNFVLQEYLPETLENTKLFDPGNTARENEMRKYLKNLWKDKYGY